MTEERALLAGGCFWGVQDLFRRYDGVLSTRVGYTGGNTPNATYRNHGAHAEAVEIIFDPAEDQLSADPRVLLPDSRSEHEIAKGVMSGRAIDRRSSTRPRSSVGSPRIRLPMSMRLGWVWQSCDRVVPAGDFWEAEPEHQDYLLRNPGGYTCHFVRPGWSYRFARVRYRAWRDWPWRWTHALATGPHTAPVRWPACAVSPPGGSMPDQQRPISRGFQGRRVDPRTATASRPASTSRETFRCFPRGRRRMCRSASGRSRCASGTPRSGSGPGRVSGSAANPRHGRHSLCN